MSLDRIQFYFPDLTDQQYASFEQLEDLYRDWNSKINVISRKDIDELYVKHVLHSLGIAKIISFNHDTEVLDVGTGGGFPGIPLAILFPHCHFHLVDSIGKKIKVVKEIAAALNLKNIKAENMRAESVDGKYDFIVSRAVTKMSPFYTWVKDKVKKESKNALNNGILCLKGGDLIEELEDFGLYCQTFGLSTYFKEEFFQTKKVVYAPY